MIAYAVTFAYGCIGLAMLITLARVLFSREIGDRILALDTLVVNSIGLIVLFGITSETQIYFEAAMIIAMLGFVSTVAYARFLLRGNIIE